MEIFLIIIFILFIGFYLLKRFWPLIVKFALKKMQQKMQDRYERSQNRQQENSRNSKKKKDSHSNSTDNLGEYVDYEEID